METIDALYLRKYLSSDRELEEVVGAMFSEAVQVGGLAGLRLSQVDGEKEVYKIVERGRILDDEDTLIKLPVLFRDCPVMYVTACYGHTGLNKNQMLNFANIVLAVQSIVARIGYMSDVEEQTKETEVKAAVEQKAAVEETVAETVTKEPVIEEKAEEPEKEVAKEPAVTVIADVSVEELYEGVFAIMNKIPAGFAVLDNKKGEVLYMNKMAEETIPAQNAMGAALMIYEEKGQGEVGKVQDEDSGLWYDISFVPVKWSNGDEVLMSAAIDTQN